MHGNRRSLKAACLAAIAALSTTCGGGQAPPPTQNAAANLKRVDDSKAGGLTGRVSYEGPAVQNPRAKLESDPACASQFPDGLTLDTVLVTNGGLENVFVYIKSGLSGYQFDVPTTPVVLDQKGCHYTPHVFGLRTGQPLEIVNSDETMHNVHAAGSVNQEFNFAQPFKGIKHNRTFTAPEVMVPFKCNVHSWMTAYAGVVDHPYFAVTSGGGTFELKNVPAGTYTIEAWHEKLGARTATVTLGEKESKPVNFAFGTTNP
jgi:plastocyanin